MRNLSVLVAAAASCFALAFSIPAQGRPGLLVSGAGFGHGVGLSQYGAYGFAKHGRDHREILAHYYKGTQIGPAETRDIRVLLQDDEPYVTVRGALRAGQSTLDPRMRYRVHPLGTSGLLLEDRRGRPIGRFSGPVRMAGIDRSVRLSGCALNGVEDGHYRGVIEVRRSTDGGFAVVNELSVDDYVQGVIPGEVPADWPAEALKAQAVAARSYALATNVAGEVFDQYPDDRSQVYRGADSERPATNAAAQATAGQVLRHGGRVIVANFFSTSGGRTENVENSFEGSAPRPYLVSVEDPFDHVSPRHRWRLGYTATELEGRLEEHLKGSFQGIRAVERGRSPRVVEAEVVGSEGLTRLSGTELKADLGLHDTWAYFSRVPRRVAARAPSPPEVAPPGERGCTRIERVGLARDDRRPEPPPTPARGRRPSPASTVATLGAALEVQVTAH